MAAIKKYHGLTLCTQLIAAGHIVMTKRTKAATANLIKPMSHTFNFFILSSKILNHLQE